MEHQNRKILLAGYAADVGHAATFLAGYPGEICTADERTLEPDGSWKGAVVVYVFGADTGFSSQVKSVLLHLQRQLEPEVEVVALCDGVEPRDVLYPEFEHIEIVRLSELGELLKSSPKSRAAQSSPEQPAPGSG